MCYFNRLPRVVCWLADYLECLQFCWDFVKSLRNDEIALQHFFFLAYSSARIFFLYHLCCMQFFSSNKRLQEIFFQNHPPPPQELNSRPLTITYNCILFLQVSFLRTEKKNSCAITGVFFFNYK